jgi:hypothetical protein
MYMTYRPTHDRKIGFNASVDSRDARRLLDWLNRAMSRKDEGVVMALTRVQQIVDRLAKLEEKQRALRPKRGRKNKPTEIKKEEAAINMMIARYEFNLFLDTSQSEPGVWAPFPTQILTDDHPLVQDETRAVYYAIELAKQGWLSKIRKCDGCGRYFYARLTISRFHDMACRTAFWERSPERKKQKRQKAKDYYDLKKSGKVK